VMLIRVGTFNGHGVWLESTSIMNVVSPKDTLRDKSVRAVVHVVAPNGDANGWYVEESIDATAQTIQLAQAVCGGENE